MSKQAISELKVIHSDLTSEDVTWQELNKEGAVIKDTGNSELYNTGAWMPKKLKFSSENCINCSLCWAACPDDAIVFDDKGNMIGIDTDHCKDCALCVAVCPKTKGEDESKHALVMHDNFEETDF